MTLLLPGVRSLRNERRSGLAFYWHARDASLVPVTGQAYQFNQAGALGLTGGNVTPGVGSVVVAGKAMPRFSRKIATGENVLGLMGNAAGSDVEQLLYFGVFPARDCTFLMRFTGLWTAGANLTTAGGLFGLGTDSQSDAGVILVQRETTQYKLIRQDAAHGVALATLTENAALVWPADLLMTYVGATGIASLSVRGANGTVYGPVTAGGASYVSALRWGGQAFSIGQAGVASAPIESYFVKLAMGIKTYAQMDVLV